MELRRAGGACKMLVIVFRSRIRSNPDLSGINEAGVRMYDLASAKRGPVSYKEFNAKNGEACHTSSSAPTRA